MISFRAMRSFLFLPLILWSCSTKVNNEKSAIKEKATREIIEINTPASPGSGEPNLFVTEDGKVYLSWIAPINEKESALQFSRFKNNSWTTPVTIAQGGNWFINWADFPSLTVTPDGTMAAHWLKMSGEGTYHYDIQIAQSHDSGRNWEKPITPHKDGKKAEHGFVSLVPIDEDQLFVTWLDGRNMANMDHNTPASGASAMTLRSAQLNKYGQLSEERMLDGRVCDCCQTGAAITSNGPVVVYRNRSADEVRDIYITREVSGHWTEPKAIAHDKWQIQGCPVNGPAIDANKNNVVVGWFTSAKKNPRVNIAYSKDGGKTFTEPIKVDHGNPLGRVDVILLPDHTAMISWMENNEKGRAQILAARVAKDGTVTDEISISNSSATRASGFPRMINRNNELFFAWTSADSITTIKTAKVKLNL